MGSRLGSGYESTVWIPRSILRMGQDMGLGMDMDVLLHYSDRCTGDRQDRTVVTFVPEAEAERGDQVRSRVGSDSGSHVRISSPVQQRMYERYLPTGNQAGCGRRSSVGTQQPGK